MLSKKPVVCGIVAVGPNNIIGCDNSMPWHSRRDMAYFRQTTMGHPCIFGKNTYENLPIKPLPGRLNIVCSSSYKIERKGDVLYVPSLEEAIKQCGNTGRVFVCGGAVLYKYALEHNLIDVMFLTRIHILDEALKKQITDGSQFRTYFPYKFDWRQWNLYSVWDRSSLSVQEKQNIKAYFYKYERIK
jgi:dihydrofolate reductase